MLIHFHQYENATLTDKRLSGTTRTLYDFMFAHSHLKSHDFSMSIRQLAEGISRAMITARFHLNKLIAMGFVTRILQKDSFNPRWNKESRFIVHQIPTIDPDDYHEVSQSENSGKHIVPPIEKSIVTPFENQEGKEEIEEKRKDKKLTLKREAKTPLPAEYDKDRKRQARILALKDVPDILRTTAEYLLQKTDRFHITPHELEVLRSLVDTHTPVRIQKEIDKCCERFIRLNKNLRQLTFNYIGKCLEKQRSLVRKKRPSESHVEAPVTQREAEEVQECLMPLEEAQQVISEYAPEKPKEESLPKETEELYERLQTVSDEKVRIYNEYVESLPRDEYGCTIFPEKDPIDYEITMDEYLKLKYPEAEDEELRTDNIRDQRGLEDAKKIDTGCATCKSPDTCWLPNGYKIGRTRPNALLMADARGRKHLELRYGGCIKCKHGERKQRPIDHEFESRLKQSGLTELQAHQTFEHHEHVNVSPEIVIAKAQAILAVQKGTSLILAGKAGTGKTHLAIAIAIETMKRGRQALFRNVPELLDELRERARNYDDFYQMMRKYKDVSCLVLDDLGKEKTTQAGLDYLYQIIDARYRNGRQTIVTTNALSIEGLKNRWNEGVIEPLISRILENGEYVRICEGENRRLKKPQRLPEEKSAPMAVSESKDPEVSVRIEESRSLREILPDNAPPQERCQKSARNTRIPA